MEFTGQNMTSTNRSVTLTGANLIFQPLEIVIEQHEMGYYFADFDGVTFQRKNLTALCQELISHLNEYRSALSAKVN